MVFEWLTARWADVAQRVPPFVLAFMPNVGGGCSAQRWQRAKAFFTDPAHVAPGSDVQIAKAGQRVEACVRLREREGAAVESWLRSAK